MEISVIVPVYNCEKYLARCLNSILNQTFEDFELIVVNNGSVDGSAKICVEFAEKDQRIHYVQKENTGGAGEPRNKGLDEARGTYVVFVDADDYLDRDTLQVMYSEMVSMDYDMVIAGYHSFSENGDISEDTVLTERELVSEAEVRRYFSAVYPNGEAGYLWNKIYRRDIIEHFQVRFPSYSRLEDGFFNVDYFSHVTKCRIIPNVFYQYRLNDQKDLFRKSPRDYGDLIEVLVKHYYETIQQWGLEPADCEGEVCKFALNELEVCFENAFCGGWEMSREEMEAYISELRERELIGYLLDRRRYVKRYVAMVMRLFQKKHDHLMIHLVRDKVWQKRHLGRMYQSVKRVLNG